MEWLLRSIHYNPAIEMAVGIAVGGGSYVILLILGDVLGLWRHYVRGAIRALC